jgi:5-methylcytosine-specific restriction protein A
MMFVLCRVVWASNYQSEKEEFFPGNMKYPRKHKTAHEILNFADDNGYVYGFVEHNGDNINLRNLGAGRDASESKGATVIWCGLDPNERRLRVVGWYENATVYAKPQRITRVSTSREWVYQFKAAYKDSHLIPVADRFLEVPMRSKITDRGYIGQRNWFFPEKSDKYDQFLSTFKLLTLGRTGSKDGPPRHDRAFEEGQRQIVEINVNVRNPKLVEAAKRHHGLRCQVCDFSFEDRYGDIGKGFIEVHHLVPLASRTNKERTDLDEVRVLCANCHRMAHRRVQPYSLEELKQLLK